MTKQKLIFLSFFLLIPFFQLKASESIIESQKKLCKAPPVFFEEKACSSENFFKTEVSPKIENINKIFQKNLDEAFYDNQANHEFSVQETIKNFRIYHYCFEDLCDRVFKNCASNNSNARTLEEFKWCKNKQEKLELLQKRKIHFIVTNNIERKHRSLFEEKINALGSRFNQFIHPKMKEINSTLDKAKGSIGKFLILYPKGS